MKQAKAEAQRWLAQAENDLAFAELGVKEGYYAQACFISQQAAEKALKALHYFGGARFVFGHSLVELLDALRVPYPALEELRPGAQQLDQYYVPTRYPNSLPGGTPSEIFTKTQATPAVEYAKEFIERAKALVAGC